MRAIVLCFLCFTIFQFSSCTSTSEGEKVEIVNPLDKEEGHPANLKSVANAQDSKKDHLEVGGMNWLTIEEIAANKGNGDKKYLIDVYTEWCGWCKVMDRKTFADKEVQAYLKENFNIVKFDAEQKTDIKWQNKNYEFVPSGKKGVHTLAIELLGNRLGYPTLVYLDEKMNIIKSSPGFKDPEKLLAELRQL